MDKNKLVNKMKKQIMIIAVVLMSMGAYAQQEKTEVEQVKKYDVSADFKKQLNVVFTASLDFNETLYGNTSNISNKAKEVNSALGKVNMGLLKGDAHMAWMTYLKDMKGALDQMSKSADVKVQRLSYAQYNQGLYRSIKAFGIGDATAYYQYCPMANKNQGAYWLSDTKAIRNPYFGEMMSSCGSTKETLD
jgi:Cu(I)/Ag(I) efflux system membrane fusion protein